MDGNTSSLSKQARYKTLLQHELSCRKELEFKRWGRGPWKALRKMTKEGMEFRDKSCGVSEHPELKRGATLSNVYLYFQEFFSVQKSSLLPPMAKSKTHILETASKQAADSILRAPLAWPPRPSSPRAS